MIGLVRAFWSDEGGATAIEYAMIAALISVTIIGALSLVNQSMIDMFEYIRSHIVGAIGG